MRLFKTSTYELKTTEIQAIFDHFYPTAAAAILTGSQLHHEHIDPAHDVDIIILDPRFSVISASTRTVSGITFDFVHLPLNDLDNCLQNESFDLKGILFLMIRTGSIIRESEQGIAASLQKAVNDLYQHLSPAALNEYNRLVSELTKLKKDVLRRHKVYNAFFLLHDFFSLITEAEVIRQTNWKHSGKHKAMVMLKGNPAFGKAIVRNMIRFHASPTTESLSWIRHYIDIFTAMPLPTHPQAAQAPLYIFDIGNLHNSIDQFINETLSLIIEDPFLSAKYQGFYLSPRRYDKIYRNLMSLVFKPAEDDLGDLHIYLLKKLRGKDLSAKLNTAPSYIADRIVPFTAILNETSTMLGPGAEKKSHDYERNLLTLLLLSAQLFKNLDIAIADFLRLTFYLTNRYLLNKKSQDAIDTLDQHRAFIDKRMASFHKYYMDNKSFLDTLLSDIWSGRSTTVPKSYTRISLAVQDLTNSYFSSGLPGTYDLTVRVLESHYGQSEPDRSAFFVAVFENLYSFLLLTPEQSALALFLLSESLNTFIHTEEDRNRT